MEILHFKDLGDIKVSSTNAVDILFVLQILHLCIMEILHFEDLGNASVIWLRMQLF